MNPAPPFSRLTNNLPNGRRGQILALVLLGVALLAIWLSVFGPLVHLYAARNGRIEFERQTVTKMAHLQQILPHLHMAVKNLPAGETWLLDGASDAIASANLQDRIQHIAASTGTELMSSETLPPVPEGHYQRIGLHVTLVASFSVLIQFLTNIDAATPSMVVERLHLHEAETGGVATEAMSCELSLFAYHRVASTSGRSAR